MSAYKVLLFQDRFASLVASGSKRHTIRLPRKRPIRVGHTLSLRQWSGKAYRSKQIELLETKCIAIDQVVMTNSGLYIGGIEQDQEAWDAMAKTDGFESIEDMVQWFVKEHRMDQQPFVGELIRWKA